MNRHPLKDRQFRTIGYIDEEPGGKQTLRDAQFRIKGYYDPKTNQTKDAQFHLVGMGNILTSLLDD
jgi:hypothetical protein